MYMKYSLFLLSLPSASSLFPPLHLSVSCTLFTSDIVRGSCWKVCVWGDNRGITRILLDSGALSADASHLRHGHARPSEPSARLPLIDLSLDRGVSWFFRENLCWQVLCSWVCSIFQSIFPAAWSWIILHCYVFERNSICILNSS